MRGDPFFFLPPGKGANGPVELVVVELQVGAEEGLDGIGGGAVLFVDCHL